MFGFVGGAWAAIAIGHDVTVALAKEWIVRFLGGARAEMETGNEPSNEDKATKKRILFVIGFAEDETVDHPVGKTLDC